MKQKLRIILVSITTFLMGAILFFVVKFVRRVEQRSAPQVATIGVRTPNPSTEPSCYRAYSELFQNEIVEISIFFGYKDARPARFVGDRYEKNILLDQLLSPCVSGQVVCGFTRDPDDADLLTKDTVTINQTSRQIRLWLIHSSVGPDDAKNRNSSHQTWQTDYATGLFRQSLVNSDVVLYNGHSRDGGGPDFAPPHLKGSHTDYAWYAEKKPGLMLMLDALQNNSPKIIGLFSCVSEKYFSEKILQRAPNTALIVSSELLYYRDALANTLGTLSAIISHSCESDFAKALSTGVPLKGSSLQGFFKP